MKNLFFVDFENLQDFPYEKIDPIHDMVVIFVGHSQSKISFDIVKKTQKLGKSVEWIKMSGSGRNALDFHIAYYLGFFIASKEKNDAKCSVFVVSKDGDYDILIKHIQDQGHHCERISKAGEKQIQPPTLLTKIEDYSLEKNIEHQESNSHRELELNNTPAKELTDSEISDHLVETLGKVEKLKRPRTEKTLINHITAHYKKKKINLSPDKIINLLKSNKRITITEQRISYRF